MGKHFAKERTLWIRADASPRMGTGHVMRCLALAQAWRDEGGKVVFFTATENEPLLSRLEEEGFRRVRIPRPHPETADLELLLRHAAAEHPDWLVLDGYHFDTGYPEALKQAGIRVLQIDDMAHLARYDADILLNPNFGAEGLAYRTAPTTVRLLGPAYALLRREMLLHQPPAQKKPPALGNVLITLGGSDPAGLTALAIRAVSGSRLKRAAVHVVIGPANPRADEIRRAAAEAEGRAATRGVRFKIHEQADMVKLLAQADLAIAAGGGTTWELLHYGVPTILIAAAENQRRLVDELARQDLVVKTPEPPNLEEADLSAAVDRMIADPDRLSAMAVKGRRLVDGQGCRRILDLVEFLDRDSRAIAFHALLREARAEDALALWQLANDPETRRQSFRQEFIPRETHVAWLRKKLESAETLLLVAEIAGVLVGMIRLEKRGEAAEVNYALSPAFRGKGWGRRLLEAGAERGFRQLGVHVLRGTVKTGNPASIRSFEKAGFRMVERPHGEGRDSILFEKRFE